MIVATYPSSKLDSNGYLRLYYVLAIIICYLFCYWYNKSNLNELLLTDFRSITVKKEI